MKTHCTRTTDLTNCAIPTSHLQNCSGAGECRDLEYLMQNAFTYGVQN
jgi:hypothetical protein